MSKKLSSRQTFALLFLSIVFALNSINAQNITIVNSGGSNEGTNW